MQCFIVIKFANSCLLDKITHLIVLIKISHYDARVVYLLL